MMVLDSWQIHNGNSTSSTNNHYHHHQPQQQQQKLSLQQQPQHPQQQLSIFTEIPQPQMHSQMTPHSDYGGGYHAYHSAGGFSMYGQTSSAQPQFPRQMMDYSGVAASSSSFSQPTPPIRQQPAVLTISPHQPIPQQQQQQQHQHVTSGGSSTANSVASMGSDSLYDLGPGSVTTTTTTTQQISKKRRKPAPTIATGRRNLKCEHVTPEEAERRDKRRERNRKSAQRCRERKIERRETLQVEIDSVSRACQAYLDIASRVVCAWRQRLRLLEEELPNNSFKPQVSLSEFEGLMEMCAVRTRDNAASAAELNDSLTTTTQNSPCSSSGLANNQSQPPVVPVNFPPPPPPLQHLQQQQQQQQQQQLYHLSHDFHDGGGAFLTDHTSIGFI